MIELRTLGTTDLRVRDGGGIDAVLRQPKRLALLVYLALAAPGRFQRRDTLLALFWPELDQEHARSSLRRALSFLRKALPEPVIVTRGEEEVMVDPKILWTDVLEFERGDGTFELYQGEFLTGFYVSGAPEVEQWLDGQRTRLRLRAAELAWSAAERGTEPAERVRMIRRAIALAPLEESAVLRGMRLLDRPGAGTEAARIGDEYIQRLGIAEEPGPSPAFAATLARLKRDHPAGDESAPWKSGLVAVLPFAVHGSTDLGFLAEGMVDLLSTALDGAGRIACVDPRTILAEVRSGEGLDPARGQAIARRFGAERFILGSIVSAGGRLQATAMIYDRAQVPLLRAEAKRVGEGELFELVDDLVRQLVAGLERSPAGRLNQLAALTTGSIPALKLYLSGEATLRLGRYFEAILAFQQAAALDESFALAHFRLASALAASVMIAPAREAMERAWQHRARLSDRDRLLLAANRAWLLGRSAEAEQQVTSLLSLHPEDVEGWFLLGDLFFHSNPLRGRSATEARPAFERALALDPGHMGALAHLIRIAALERRTEEVNRLVERAGTLSPAGDQWLGLQALSAWLHGDEGARRAVLAQVPAARVLAAGTAFADLSVQARELAGAEEFLSHCLAAARSDRLKAMYRILGASVTFARGRRRAALEALAEGARIDPDSALMARAALLATTEPTVSEAELQSLRQELVDWNAAAAREPSLPLPIHDGLYLHLRLYLLGLVETRLSIPAAAAKRAEEMTELDVPKGAEVLIARLGRTLDALALQAQGRLPEALAALEGARTDVWFQLAIASPFFAGGFERVLRADLLIALGRDEEAAAWLSTIAQRSPFETPYLAQAEERLIAIALRRGDATAAASHRSERARILGEADPAA
ncbi:MAG TPA: hypothetical protein VJN95_12640 [Gemmatimonadales bacterium]|nr:hypothetical protein [Gemmatimonadales bacterium]